MNFRGGEFSTGELENFHPALTMAPLWAPSGAVCDSV
jgi:hypothetical protein